MERSPRQPTRQATEGAQSPRWQEGSQEQAQGQTVELREGRGGGELQLIQVSGESFEGGKLRMRARQGWRPWSRQRHRDRALICLVGHLGSPGGRSSGNGREMKLSEKQAS